MQLGPLLVLENFTFPLPPKESLDFDMKRSISKLEFPGGPPIYQDMGMSEKTLDFSGAIIGDNAVDLSNEIETLWWSGKELQFSYGGIQKRVRIESYKPRIRRSDRVDYSIHLLVCFPESELNNANAGTEIPQLVDNPSDGNLNSIMDRAYAIKSGDTLWDIAAGSDVFADGSKWEIIAAANGITDEYSLQVGQMIKLPSPGNAQVAISTYYKSSEAVVDAIAKAELLAMEGGAA